MRLFSKQEVDAKLKNENEHLVQTNARLRKVHNEWVIKLNNVKANYDPEKVKLLQEYEKFRQDIKEKTEQALQELDQINNDIKQKKEILYGFVEKQDAFDLRVQELKDWERKLETREAYVEQLNRKINLTPSHA